ncbi:hypothetical protein A306_00000375, partial [Columba livia]
MESAARLRTALIPLDEEKSSGPFHKQRVAEHCGVFRDLFRGATFPPGHLEGGVQPGRRARRAGLLWEHGDSASSSPAVSSEADKGSLQTDEHPRQRHAVG